MERKTKQTTKYTKQQFERAIMLCKGVNADIAKHLGCAYNTVINAYKRYPELQKLRDDCFEETFDELEKTAWHEAIVNKNTALIIFLLKTRRPEKYSETYHLKHSGQIGIQLSAEAQKALQVLGIDANDAVKQFESILIEQMQAHESE